MTTRTATLLAATALLRARRPPRDAAGEIAIEAHGGYFEMAAENSASGPLRLDGRPHLRRCRALQRLARRLRLGRRADLLPGGRARLRREHGLPCPEARLPALHPPHPDPALGRLPLPPRPSAGALRRRRRRHHLLRGGERGDRRDVRRRQAPKTGFVGHGGARGRPRATSASAPRSADLGARRHRDRRRLEGLRRDDLGGVHAIGKLIVAF